MGRVIQSSKKQKKTIGVVFTGGGARGAYQAGVIRAITEIAAREKIPQHISVVTGVSAGSINACYFAAMIDRPVGAAGRMARLWSQLRSDEVFRTDALAAGKTGFRMFLDAAIGAFYRRKLARSLLDTRPLRELLARLVPFEKIQDQIDRGYLRGAAVTAMNYSTGQSQCFVQGVGDIAMWRRHRRFSQRSHLGVEHVMASSAIPFIFPPFRVGIDHFGDGCLRNTVPMSPAIHLGADKVFVISTRRKELLGEHEQEGDDPLEPTVARVLGVVLNAVLLDSVDIDIERLKRINETLDQIPIARHGEMPLRKIDHHWIRPSVLVSEVALKYSERLPTVIRYLINGLGSEREASELTSYILFDPKYCGDLVELGYQDGMNQASEILEFFTE